MVRTAGSAGVTRTVCTVCWLVWDVKGEEEDIDNFCHDSGAGGGGDQLRTKGDLERGVCLSTASWVASSVCSCCVVAATVRCCWLDMRISMVLVLILFPALCLF